MTHFTPHAPFGRRTWATALLLITTIVSGFACSTAGPPLRVVDNVDIERYAGGWYEIASYPQRFQRGCVATTAVYTPTSANEILVENSCRDGSFDGELRSIEGLAWVEDPDDSTSKLRVQFFWPFSGKYWVIDLDPSPDPEYQYAVVGHPSREYLWVLSRKPKMADDLYAEIVKRVVAQGYDPSLLVRTPQPLGPE
jgi:apolipoprotein D and lipocalin family protein